MIVEAIYRPLRYRWPGGEVYLAPGHPVDLPADRAQRLLAKAKGKVRLVGGSCYACGSRVFWLSVYDSLVCCGCHPPADPRLVKEWLRVDV
jgi:hypothetical protein